MIAVAVCSPLLLLLREDGLPMAGASIVGACILVLAYKLTIDAIRQERAAGRPFGAWRIAGAGLGALTCAILFIGVADLAFLTIYHTIAAMFLGRHDFGRNISIVGFLTGLGAVVFATSQLRRLIRNSEEARDLAKSKRDLPDEIRIDEWK
jgi:hypothetical protein